MSSAPTREPLLTIEDLGISFRTADGTVAAVRGIDLELHKGEILGVVGESGSGKSVTAMSLLGLNGRNADIVSGSVTFEGQDLLHMPNRLLRTVRGNQIAMVFQDPISSLNPLMTIGNQVGEVLRIHRRDLSKAQRRERVIELLRLVRIPEPESRVRAFPHELSGGMRQRVMIAQALACTPDILLADEPTTALDVTIQRQILDLLVSLRDEIGMGVIFVTHDLGVVADLCDRVMVVYGGMVMEQASIDALQSAPAHPYTIGLMQCAPRPDQDRSEPLTPIPGSPPDMLAPPRGCPFAPRCPRARAICHEAVPPLYPVDDGQAARCWMWSPQTPPEYRIDRSEVRP